MGERVAADALLTDALIAGTPSARAGTVVSVDVFYEAADDRSSHDALAVEMEAAALFAVGAAAEVPVACVLAVSDTFAPDGARQRIDDDSLLEGRRSDGRRRRRGARGLRPQRFLAFDLPADLRPEAFSEAPPERSLAPSRAEAGLAD